MSMPPKLFKIDVVILMERKVKLTLTNAVRNRRIARYTDPGNVLQK